jgi:hypothetical protein
MTATLDLTLALTPNSTSALTTRARAHTQGGTHTRPQGFVKAGFAVDRFVRAPSSGLGAPMNKFYIDITPATDEATIADNLHTLANIRGPAGGRIIVHFNKDICEKIFPKNCGFCFKYKGKCICAKALSSGAGPSADRAAKRGRDLTDLEEAFGI